MNFKPTNRKTWLVAAAVCGLVGGAAFALPGEASARGNPADHGRIHERIHNPLKYKGKDIHHVRIESSRIHRPGVEKRFHRRPAGKIVQHRRPPIRTVVVDRPRLRLWWPAIVASFSYHLSAGPRYDTSAPIYTSVETGVSSSRYTSVQRISVSTDLLNVRSGPNLNNPVISTVSFGVVLPVHGAAQGWLYITLPDGRPGWVMERYTRRM